MTRRRARPRDTVAWLAARVARRLDLRAELRHIERSGVFRVAPRATPWETSTKPPCPVCGKPFNARQGRVLQAHARCTVTGRGCRVLARSALPTRVLADHLGVSMDMIVKARDLGRADLRRDP